LRKRFFQVGGSGETEILAKKRTKPAVGPLLTSKRGHKNKKGKTTTGKTKPYVKGAGGNVRGQKQKKRLVTWKKP